MCLGLSSFWQFQVPGILSTGLILICGGMNDESCRHLVRPAAMIVINELCMYRTLKMKNFAQEGHQQAESMTQRRSFLVGIKRRARCSIHPAASYIAAPLPPGHWLPVTIPGTCKCTLASSLL